jgi:RNA polymerase sigma-32 factor
MAARKKAGKTETAVEGEVIAPKPRAKAGPKEVLEGEVVADEGRGRGAGAPASTSDSETTAEVGEEIEPDVSELEEVSADLQPAVPVARRSGGGGLSRADPLAAYMAEVTRHPLLTREEEVALAKRYRDTGDVKAAYKLVSSNLRLVVKLAHEYHRNPLSLLDLVQEGNIGLMQAVKKFDPERGVKLASYAAWWIRAYILRYIMDNWKMVKLGTTEAQRKLFFKLRQEQERLLKQGFEVTPKLLADRLNVSEQDVIEMDQRLGNDEVSIDAPLPGSEDDKATRADKLLPSGAPAADDTLGNAELREIFRTKLAAFSQNLNEKEKFIFEKRLIADEPLTLQDIGAHYGFSRERARQLEAQLIDRMRKYMREEIPDFDLVAEAERE